MTEKIEALPDLGKLSIESDEIKSLTEDEYIIKEKLDILASLLIDCYEKLLIERKLLDNCLNDGYLNLSKARSQIGCASLSIMQVPADELKSFVKVDVKNVDKSSKLNENEDIHIDYKTLSFDLIFDVNESNKKSEDMTNNEQYAPLIKWFGAFPSLSLRQSQKAFSKSIFIIKNISDLQAKLKSLNTLYDELLKKLKTSK